MVIPIPPLRDVIGVMVLDKELVIGVMVRVKLHVHTVKEADAFYGLFW